MNKTIMAKQKYDLQIKLEGQIMQNFQLCE